jgi:aldose 1-epimerase
MQAIQIRSSQLCATLLPKGASLVGLCFGSNDRNLVLGLDALSQHTNIPAYAGALVGPVANRVSKGRVLIDGTLHQMRLNEAGRTSLHSGPNGLDTQNWTVTDQSDSAVTFEIALPDGACGLPGNRNIKAIYALADDMLTLVITATTDAASPINIAAHPYWNLDGKQDVTTHQLQIASARYTPTDARNIPTGEILLARNTNFDFSSPAFVTRDPALDINYCLSDISRDTPEWAATLTGSNGTSLQIATTLPGLQVYNGAFLPDMPEALSQNRDMKPFGGIALEPQHWPDAPNQPDFPQITLLPDQTYRQITTYQLSQK